MPTKCCWVIHAPRQSDQRTQSFHFPIVVHQSLDPAAQSSAQAPSSLSLHALRSSSARQAQPRSERVDALGQRAVEVIICMITRDFSVISMTSQASLSLSLSLSLPLSQKSLTHNIGSASALPIISVGTSIDVTHVTSRFYKWPPFNVWGAVAHTYLFFFSGRGSTALLRRSIQVLYKTGGELSFTARCLLSLCDIGKWSCYQRETFDRIFWLLVATAPY